MQVIGRNEMHITWDPPEVPLGRITRYDLSMNGRGVYSGMELSFSAHRLIPDTDYTFVVSGGELERGHGGGVERKGGREGMGREEGGWGGE